jgi:hypothetical protein
MRAPGTFDGVSLGSVGIAIAACARAEAPSRALTVAMALLAAAGLAASGIERVFRAIDARTRATLTTAFVLSGAALAARVLLGASPTIGSVVAPSSIVGDALAIGLVLSFESSTPRRTHRLAPAVLLIVSFAAASVAPPLALAGLALLAVRELAQASAQLRPRDLVPALAVAVAVVTCRPAVTVLLAIGLALALVPPAQQRKPE